MTWLAIAYPMPSEPSASITASVSSSATGSAVIPVSSAASKVFGYPRNARLVSLVSGLSTKRSGPAPEPSSTSSHSVISPRKMLPNSSNVTSPAKGLSGLTKIAIFSRAIGTATRPAAISSSVSGRPIAAKSISPFSSRSTATSEPLAALSTVADSYRSSNCAVSASFIERILLEPSIKSVSAPSNEAGAVNSEF